MDDYKYDYLFIGTGNSALTAAALLANAGKKVCMLEAHDIPGGYAQSFKWGEQYYFCGQVHYIWGCGPALHSGGQGGKIYEFLKKIGLEKTVTFELYDPKGYDVVRLPDQKRVAIPYGFDNLIVSIDKAYPGERAKLEKFVKIIETIRYQIRIFPENKENGGIHWWEYLTQGWRFLALIKYRYKTLQDVFDECGLSKEAQAVLAGDAGDFMLPPEKLAIFAYVGLFCGYNTGAYYPTKHYKFYFDSVAKSITDHRGCHIFYKSLVTKIETEGDRVTSVTTKDGRTFTARTIVCNMDPQAAAKMIGLEKFPAAYAKRLQYEYSGGSMMIYLGLKNIDLEKCGLGRFNIWHLAQWDVNKIWKDQQQDDFSKPWFFMSTPTLHSKEPGTTPPGNHIVEIATYAEYTPWKNLKDRDIKAYEIKKNELAERILDLIEKEYIPNLREHIDVKVIGSPTTNEDWVWAPIGNAYGQNMTVNEVGPGRLKMETPFTNFYFCNATAGYASIHGTTGNGMDLYMKLTGDHFYDAKKAPTDAEFVVDAWKRGATVPTIQPV